MLNNGQIVAIVLGSTLGLAAGVAIVQDGINVFRKHNGAPLAVAYGVSAFIAAIGLAALVVLLGFTGTRLPAFGYIFPLYVITVLVAYVKKTKTVHIIAFVAAAALYWNVSLVQHRSVIAAATPPLITHAGFATILLRPALG